MSASRTRARRGLPIAGALFVAIMLVAAGAMYLYDHGRRETIAKGVRIDGVDVGGLRAAAAREKVQREVVAQLSRPVTVTAGTRKWTLSAREAALTVNTASMVDQAVRASREGSIVTRTIRGLSGGSVNRDVPLAISYSHGAVRGLTAQVRAAVNREPRDASVQPGTAGLTQVEGATGTMVESTRLGARIDRALIGAAKSRMVRVPVKTVAPAVSSAQLAERYPAYIVVDRGAFRLSFYEHLKLTKTYEIAVGMEGLETPSGLHKIEWEQENPSWYVPKKAWAGALAGTVVPPGPTDPLKARFMSFDGGAGIHGIDPSEYSSIGHNASHGCVRMRIPDVISLYAKSPVGTPVYII